MNFEKPSQWMKSSLGLTRFILVWSAYGVGQECFRVINGERQGF